MLASRACCNLIVFAFFVSPIIACNGSEECVTADGVARISDVESTSPACGVVNTGLVDKQFAIGVMNNSGRAPQSAPLLHLRFNQAPADENDAVVAVAVRSGGIVVDGTTTEPTEWAGVPSKDVSLRPPHEVIPDGLGLNPANLTAVDHGISLVRVWAAYDSDYLYMRLRWRDDTRNDTPGRWTYTATGWRRNQGPKMSEVDPSIDHTLLANEAMDASQDQVAVMFNKNSHDFEARNGCGGMCHLEGLNPASHPNSVYNRGGRMMTTTPGEVVDSWIWRAGTTNPIGLADDMYWHCGGSSPTTTCDPAVGTFDLADASERAYYFVPIGQPICTGLSGIPQPDPSHLASPPAPAVDDLEHYVGNWYIEAPASNVACIDHGPSQRPAGDPSQTIYQAGSPYIGVSGDQAVPVDGSENFTVGTTLSGQVFRNIDGETATCARCDVKARGTYDDTEKWWDVGIKRSLVAAQADVDVDFTVDELL